MSPDMLEAMHSGALVACFLILLSPALLLHSPLSLGLRAPFSY